MAAPDGIGLVQDLPARRGLRLDVSARPPLTHAWFRVVAAAATRPLADSPSPAYVGPPR